MMQYIDTHFHTLHMIQKGFDPKELFESLQQEGFAGGIDVGTHHNDILQRKNLLEDIPGVLLSGGIHPGNVGRYPFDELLSGVPLLVEAPVSFIGECGIDLYHRQDTLDEQMELFALQLQISRDTGLPVIIHSRDAEDQVLSLLKQYPPASGGIMHCFSSGITMAREVLDMGMHISFAGNITYKKNSYLREVLKAVPPDRLLLETDSPFLSPVPKRGKPNHPGRILHTYRLASKLLDISVEDLCQQVQETFLRLTGALS